MGSAGMNDGSLYTRTFFSRKFLSSFLVFNWCKLTNCLIQIFNQIVGIFNTHTDANQGIAKAVFNSLFPWNGSVGHSCGMTNQDSTPPRLSASENKCVDDNTLFVSSGE